MRNIFTFSVFPVLRIDGCAFLKIEQNKKPEVERKKKQHVGKSGERIGYILSKGYHVYTISLFTIKSVFSVKFFA